MTSGLIEEQDHYHLWQGGLSNEEIKRMIKDAGKYNIEDENGKKVEAKEALLVCILAL